jgi:hypothetical protein
METLVRGVVALGLVLMPTCRCTVDTSLGASTHVRRVREWE